MGITIICTVSFHRRMSAILYILENGLFRYIIVNTLHDNGIIIIISEYSNSCTGLFRYRGFHKVEASRFQDNRHMKVVRLSALRTGHLYHQGNIPGTHFCQRLSRPQGHSAAGMIVNEKIQMTPSGIEPVTFQLVP